MSKRHQSKSGTKKSKRNKIYHAVTDAPSSQGDGVMTGMVSNFRQMVSLEQKSGSKIGRYFWGALLAVLVIALAFFAFR